jgi:hypothetical protein
VIADDCMKRNKKISAEFSVYVDMLICTYKYAAVLACAWRCPQVRMRTRCRWTSAGVMAPNVVGPESDAAPTGPVTRARASHPKKTNSVTERRTY